MSLPKTDFGPPPPNYVAGLARGAVGFITRSDIGPANYTSYDQWSGYQENIFGGEKLDDEDKEADIMYRQVDIHLEGRRRKQIEQKEKEDAKKMLDKNPSVAFQFADLKRGLGTVTADEWNMIPEAQDYSIKKQKNDKYTPVPDHIIEGARREGATVSHIDVTTPLNLNDIGKANMTVLTAKLDKSTDQVSGFSTIDKSGYLTGLNSQVINTSADIGDVKRARKLMFDMINTDPKNLNGWIGLARVEEIDGKMQQARNVLYQGLQHCQRHEDIWIEISRFETPEKAKALLAQAALILPKSLKIWLTAADLEQAKEMKVKVLRKALEHIADQPKLWKKLIEYEKEREAKVLLYKAVECIPGDLEMWLALAKLETYDNAKAVLNRARKALPQEPAIWINAAKLEESEGSQQEKITKILQIAIATYQKQKYNINKDDWLEEAAYCEKSGNPLTCVAIVRAIVLHDVNDASDQERILIEEAKRMIDSTCLGTARAIFEYGIEVLAPQNVFLLQQTINFELNTGKNQANLEKLYKQATTEHTSYEVFWIQRIQFHWNQAKKIAESRARSLEKGDSETDVAAFEELQAKAIALREQIKDLFAEAQQNLPESEQILMLSVKFLKESNQIDAARDLIAVAKKTYPSAKTFIASMKLEFQAGQYAKANADAVSAMSAFPNEEKIFILAAKIANKFKSIEQARQVFEKGIRFNPLSVLLITRYVEFEINHGFFPRARPILEKFRVKLPKCPELWVTAVQLEIEAENKKGARYMLARALKECPDYNQLWSFAIELEPKATRKKKIVEALDKCRQDPYVNISVGKLFWKERKMEKARKWIEKATFERPEIVDSWAAIYLLELEESGAEKALSVLTQAKAVDSARQGRLYQKIKKSDEGWNYTFDQIFIKITQIIKKELTNIE